MTEILSCLLKPCIRQWTFLFCTGYNNSLDMLCGIIPRVKTNLFYNMNMDLREIEYFSVGMCFKN